MKKPSTSIRISVGIPEDLLRQAHRVAPRSLRLDPSRHLEMNLRSWVEERNEHLLDFAVRRMGKDPKLLAESRRISQEFAVFDEDGLEGS